MEQTRIKAAFYRGGTSNAVIFKESDLPASRAARDRMFLHIMGSPDANGRQLDGMGGGLSSVSKVVIVGPSNTPNADVDYTFVQVSVDKPATDYSGMCGNMSSAVGPFAVEEGLVTRPDGPAMVRVRNTNTNKFFHARFDVQGGHAVEQGDFAIPGVSGTGAKIQLDYLEPGGAVTGKLLPTGSALDTLQIPGVGAIEASLVDASNPVVFVRASDLDLTGAEAPADLDNQTKAMAQLDHIRRTASVAMGMSETPEQAALSNPKIAIVGAPQRFTSLDGAVHDQDSFDLSIRIISMENCHRAITLTGALCVAVAAQIKGSLVQQFAPNGNAIRIGNPSGVLPVQADVEYGPDGPTARSATAFRTQRRIMEGTVLCPQDLL